MPQPSATYQIQPRISVDLLPDGTMRLLYNIGPYSHQETLSPGFEMTQIKDALQAQVRANESQRAAAQAREEQQIAERRRQIWRTMATRPNQGPEFANKMVYGNPKGPDKTPGKLPEGVKSATNLF